MSDVLWLRVGTLLGVCCWLWDRVNVTVLEVHVSVSVGVPERGEAVPRSVTVVVMLTVRVGNCGRRSQIGLHVKDMPMLLRATPYSACTPCSLHPLQGLYGPSASRASWSPPGRASFEQGGGEGGRGFWTQNLVYQKWPDQIFPIVNFVFSHYGHFGLGRGGGGFGGGVPPPLVFNYSKEALPPGGPVPHVHLPTHSPLLHNNQTN